MKHSETHCTGQVGDIICSKRERCALYILHLDAVMNMITHAPYLVHTEVDQAEGQTMIRDISQGCEEYVAHGVVCAICGELLPSSRYAKTPCSGKQRKICQECYARMKRIHSLPDGLINVVTSVFDVTEENIKSGEQKTAYTDARKAIAAWLRDNHYPTGVIGNLTKSTPGTVVGRLKTHDLLMQYDKRYKRNYEAVVEAMEMLTKVKTQEFC